jgi:hypothetical protein
MEKEHEEIWRLLLEVQRLPGKTGGIAAFIVTLIFMHRVAY